MRRLLHISSRVGMPGTLLQAHSAGGRLLYLEAAMRPVSVVVGLEVEDVEQLHEALGDWLTEQHEQRAPALPLPAAVPLVAGRIGAGLRDVSASTVQFCTVRDAGEQAGSADAV